MIFKAALMHHLLVFLQPSLLFFQIPIWFNKQELKKNHLWNILAMFRNMFTLKASWRPYCTRRTISYTAHILPWNRSLYSCPYTLICKAWPVSLNLFSYRNNPCCFTCASTTLNAWQSITTKFNGLCLPSHTSFYDMSLHSPNTWFLKRAVQEIILFS